MGSLPLQRSASKNRHGNNFLKQLYCRPHRRIWLTLLHERCFASVGRQPSLVHPGHWRWPSWRFHIRKLFLLTGLRWWFPVYNLKACRVLALLSGAFLPTSVWCFSVVQHKWLNHNGAISASRHCQSPFLQMLCLLEINKFSPWDDALLWNSLE